jgi:type II secretion system protein H
MRWRTRTTSGFTLLELVLVLTILAVVLAAVAPTLSGFAAGRKPQDAAAQFVALARYARSQAIADGSTYRILFDPAQSRWWLAGEDSGNNPITGPYGRMFVAAEGVQMETDAPVVNGVPTLHFEPTGRSEPAAVRFIGPRSTVQVECVLPIDEFHVVSDGGRP